MVFEGLTKADDKLLSKEQYKIKGILYDINNMTQCQSRTLPEISQN